MAEHALPCIVCGRELRNVDSGMDNQPRDGVAWQTSGNYGSTVFDSFDGEQLEVNVCDTCLVRAGEQGRVHSGRHRRPVLYGSWVIGYEEVPYRPVVWRAGMPGFDWPDDALHLSAEDFDAPLPAQVHLNYTLEDVRRMLQDGSEAE